MVTGDVRLQRIANLDSIRVVATRQRYREFDDVQKEAPLGRFIGPAEMEWRQRVAAYTSDVMARIPGFAVVGVGSRARVVVSLGAKKGCTVPIIVDGSDGGGYSINDIGPAHIGAIAAYKPGGMAPGLFGGSCGAILIWTKR